MEEFKSLTKSELYEALERYGKKLPSINSSIVTKQWLLQVYNEEEYCPNYVDVKLRPCPRKPLKNILIYNILQILDQRKLHLSIDDSHTPDIEWCALVLSTLNPDHAFFQKSYYPSDEEKGKRGAVSNKQQISKKEANLLEGLPIQIFKKNNHLLQAEVKFKKQPVEETKFETQQFQSASKFRIQAQLPEGFSLTPVPQKQGFNFNQNGTDSYQSTASKNSSFNSDEKIQQNFNFSKKKQQQEVESNVSMQFSSNAIKNQ